MDEFTLKFIVVGDTGTGKSCMLHHYVEGKPRKVHAPTIGVEFGSKMIKLDGKSIKLQIWDTAGQERFSSVNQSYYRGAAGCMLVFDVSNRDSFTNLSKWLTDAKDLSGPNVTIALVANKVDLAEKREVSAEEAASYAEKHSLLLLETSALSGAGIEAAFITIAKAVLQKIDQGKLNPNKLAFGAQRGSLDTLTPTKEPAAKSKCC
eukprot:c8392_g1_i3.p1 GENE.c8392_g1_i3~~c8392_g1_i3.p1  ORF type:complete len:231 (-),score=56.39 c8392_g1_i3:262-879(-)